MWYDIILFTGSVIGFHKPIMNGYIDNDQQCPIVTPVGNAWVICDSKSRPGYKYYFNTLSGQAVWNLSPDEIEKAKRYTNALPISEIEKCPEPTMDPPVDSIMNQPQAGTSRMYNEPYATGQIPNIFPMALMNMNSMPGVPSISGLNPLVWSNPPNQGIAPTPVIYLAYPQMNFQQPQEYPQSFPTHTEELNIYRTRFNSRDDMFNGDKKTHDTRGKSRFAQRNMQQKSNWDGRTPDLREKLIRKRSNSLSSESTLLYGRDEEKISYQDFHDKNKNTSVQNNTEETSSKYDLSVLEKLKTSHSRPTDWFIVVDTEILLKKFQFLDKITDPDQNCYLLVPDHVMTELHERVAMGGDVQTRRILRFLSQQIEAELAFKGGVVPRNVGDNDDTYKMVATCEDLAEQNNVILLSNDVKYQRYKNGDSNVLILTLNELKQILNNARVQQATLRNKSPTLGIKIVVPNNKHRDVVPTKQMSKTSDIEVRSLVPKKKEIQSRPVPSKPDNNQIINENTRSEASVKRSETDLTPTITPEPVEIEKRPRVLSNHEERKVKLTRSTSKASSEGTQPRYRWRKRRNSGTKSKEKTPSVASDRAADETKQLLTSIGSLKPESSLVPILPKPISPMQAPSICMSSISSVKDTSRPNIVIEETSTSGVISNTTLDSDSVTAPMEPKTTVSICDDVNFEMFSVVGQSMEEVLRTRREEWVLRFVQIMEDTLKEILREEPPFQSKWCEYSPVWAADLPELARCVIKKYSEHFDVVDAANRLSFKLHKISDTKGGSMEPKQYMDMYSFGVYLIKSLKKVTVDCEDLNTADESLKKLLYDIQNANLDTGHNDTFADELNENALDVTKPANSGKELPHVFSFGAKETDKQNYNNTNSKGNLLPSREESQIQINKETQQKHLTNMKTKFFSSLDLTKRTKVDIPFLALDSQNMRSTPNTFKVAKTPPQASPSPKTSQNSPSILKAKTQDSAENNKDRIIEKNRISDLNLDAEKDSIDNTSPIKTCFVRNFNSIPQFEEKLNKKGQTSVWNEALIEEEYEEDNFDAAEFADGYNDQNERYSDNELEDGEIEDHDKTAKVFLEAPNDEQNSSCQQVNNEKFEWFIKEFTDEIRRTIRSVLALCTRFVDELKSSREPSQEIQHKMRIALASLGSIKNALNSILDSESTTSEDNIKLLLKKAKLDDCVPSKELLLEYRNIISKCGDQVKTCHHKVHLIMQVAGIQPLA